MKGKIWKFFSDMFYLLEMVAVVILIGSLCFALGHHIGFQSGLETKVTYVSEKYIMKLKNESSPEVKKPQQKVYGKIAHIPKGMLPGTIDD